MSHMKLNQTITLLCFICGTLLGGLVLFHVEGFSASVAFGGSAIVNSMGAAVLAHVLETE